MPKRKLTEIELENFKSLGLAIQKLSDLLFSDTAQPAEFRKIINVLYACSKEIGGPVEVNVNAIVEALLVLLNTPNQEHLAKLYDAMTVLKHTLQEL